MDFKQFYKTINFDIDNEIRTVFQATQGDTKSRGLLVDLIVGGVKTPVTTEKMTFFALKPDGTRVMTVGIKEGTGFRIDFTNQTFAVPGVLLCTLVLSGTNGEKIADKKFKMTVDSSLEDGAIISEDERGILDRAFELAEDIVPRMELLEDLSAQLAETDQRIDNLVTTPVPVGEIIAQEIIDARQGAGSVGANITEVKSLLAEKASLSDLERASSKPLKYGKLKMPSDFTPQLPCDFYRDNDGLIKHNMNFNKYKGGTKIYVALTGNDSTGDGSSGLPYKTLTKAITTAVAGADTKYEILISSPYLDRDQAAFQQTVTNKTIAVISTIPERTIISSNATYTWVIDGLGTYKTTRSSVGGVIDLINRDMYGIPLSYKKVATLAECQNTKGTYFKDSTTVWVHRIDELIPTHDSTIVNISVNGIDPKVSENGVIYFENILFAGLQNGNSLRVWSTDTNAVGEVCLRDCVFLGSISGAAWGCGLAIQNVKNAYSFNCIAAYNQLDGFNYHYTETLPEYRGSCFALEYNCKAYDIGTAYTGSNASNLSSAHETINILRIGTIGEKSTGGMIIDVTGCYSVLYDCHVGTPLDTNTFEEGKGNAFVFASDGDGIGLGKTYMENCSATNCTNALIIGSTHTAEVNNFKHDGEIVVNGTLNYF